MTTSNPADPIIDPPGDHGFFMFGDKVLYISHMPMFTVEKHMYQVVLRVTLPDEVMGPYRADRFASAWNLTNSDDVFTLPQIKDGSLTSYSVDVFRDYSNADAARMDPPLAKDVTRQVDEVLHFRHVDFDIPRPDHLTDLLFGRDGEAHLS